ncbi:MAG: hypothetical protein M3R41_06170 [Pseudomonadota bacterium]|nr:hypothetical protein [Pseudomonadota bacterium]
MKTILLSAVALSMVAASPAFAAVNPDRDGIGTYVITGSASNYCELGPVAGEGGQAAGLNTTVDASSNGSYGFNTSDATIHITQLQSDNNDHAKAWKASLNMRRSICNTAYTVTANSSNGGLQYQGQTTGGSNFATNLPYTVAVNFAGTHGTASSTDAHGNDYNLISSNNATAGDFKLTFSDTADNSHYLLAGDYTDTVVVKLAANTGTATS